jgi:hypothetical protein
MHENFAININKSWLKKTRPNTLFNYYNFMQNKHK